MNCHFHENDNFSKALLRVEVNHSANLTCIDGMPKFVHSVTVSKDQTRLERLKSALHLRLKKRSFQNIRRTFS